MAKNKKSQAITRWVRRNQFKHLCHCGCGEFIEVKREHYKKSVGGIPKFIKGHDLQPAEENYIPPEKTSFWDSLSEEEKQQRLSHLKNFQSGENNPSWKGGRWVNDAGYVMVLVPGHPFSKEGYVLEHRLLVEERTRKHFPDHPWLVEVDGEKYLNSTCVVHHIDENKQNNDPGNGPDDIGNLMLLENAKAHSFIHHSSLPMEERLRRIALGVYHSGSLE